MPTRENPYFTAPLGEDIDAEFPSSNLSSFKRKLDDGIAAAACPAMITAAEAVATYNKTIAHRRSIENELVATAEAVESRVNARPFFATETTISFAGEPFSTPSINWDGTATEEVEQLFELLLNCDCCEPHQERLPKTCHGWTNPPSRKELRPEVICDPNPSRCHCDCRHRARMIARQF